MENIQEKMKYLSQFGDVVYAVEFGKHDCFVVESGSLGDGTSQGEKAKDFYLFDENGKQIGYLYLCQLTMSEQEQEWEKLDGVEVAPERFFLLNDIEINHDLRRNHLGSFLLNWALKNIEKMNAETGKNIPLLFIRHNSTETIPFYTKERWGVELNQKVEDNRLGSSCYMIIKEVKSKDQFEGKVLGKYEKQNTKEDKHH